MSGRQRNRTYPDDLVSGISTDGDAAFLELVLKGGLDPNWKPRESATFPLSLLTYGSTRPKILRVLLEFGADPCHPGNARTGSDSPMYLAARSNKVDSLKLLLDHGAPLGNALFAAARHDAFEAIDFLLSKGADINGHHFFDAKNHPGCLRGPKDFDDPFDGGTALFAPMLLENRERNEYVGGSFEMAKYLLDRGASLSEKNYLGLTPYGYAQKCSTIWTAEQIELFNPANHEKK